MKLVIHHLTMEPAKWDGIALAIKILSLKDDDNNHLMYIKPSRRHIKYLRNIEIEINKNEVKEVLSDQAYRKLFDETLKGQITESQEFYCDSCD